MPRPPLSAALRLTLFSQIARFALVGFSNFGLSYAVYLCVLGFATHTIAYSAAFLAALLYTTVSNIRVVFTRRLRSAVIGAFATYYVLYFVTNLLLLHLAVDRAGVPAVWAPILILAFVVPVHFIISREIIGRLGISLAGDQ